MKQVFYLLLSVLIVLSLTNCNRPGRDKLSKEIIPDAGFGKYVTSYTTGVLSVEAPIRLRLAKPTGMNVGMDAEIKSKLFEFKPALNGKAYWIDNQTIEFVSEVPMEGGKVYEVKFALNKVADVPKKFSLFEFSFQTLQQDFNFVGEGLRTSEGLENNLMFYKGYLTTADVINPEEIEQVLTAEFNKKSVQIEWTHDLSRKLHFFKVDSLKRERGIAGKLVLEWDGKKIGIDEKGKQEVKVPELEFFNVLDVSVVYKPEKHVVVRFSDALDSKQDLKGIAAIEGMDDLRYTIEGNLIKIWTGNEVTGQKRLTLSKGIKNSLDIALKESESHLLVFENLKPAVRLIGKGVIVPQDGELYMPFEAVSLKSIDLRIIKIYSRNVHQFFQENRIQGSSELKKVGTLVYQGKVDLKSDTQSSLLRWNTYKVGLHDYIELEQGAIYRVELWFKKAYSLYHCGEEETEGDNQFEEEFSLEEEQKKWDRPGWYSMYYYPPGYRWDERDNPCHNAYYYYDRFVARNIFASNMGIIAKEGKGYQMNFAVTNLNTTEPEAMVDLFVYDYQNELIEKLTTDGRGLATVNLKKKPFLLVAERAGQVGYLRLDDGTSLSMSNFDVSGQKVQEGLKGYIYGERGVWRPGDNMYITFILEDELKRLPEGQPVIFKLINPKGQVVERRVATHGENGFYYFQAKTADDAPTGNWRASVQVGGTTFEKRLKVETVKPNRLKINLKLPELIQVGTANNAPMNVQWLHGAPARSLKAVIDLNLVSAKSKFKGYEKFSFKDPASGFSPVKQEFFKGALDETGNLSVPLKFDQFRNAPGLLKAYFTTRVFEEGGDFSINVQSAKLSPYKNYVGVKMPDSKGNWYKTDTDYLPEVVAVDANGNPVTLRNVTVELYKVDWRWWWESGEDYLAHYVRNSHRRIVKQWKIDELKGRQKIQLNIKYRNWDSNGRYMLRIRDGESGHAAGLTFYMSKWGYWRAEGSGTGATMLAVEPEKEKYQVGEKVKVAIPSSKNGRALVSLESGDGVKNIFWVETSDKNTSFEFEAKPEMAPNIYVHVSLIQPYGQTENDAPLRLYGVAPVLIENPQTILHPVIKMKDEIEPEQDYIVEVSEENGRGMTYTLAIVDEGLLDLTNFKTPDPHSSFYAREALGVKTWDMFDEVAGAYGAALEKAFAVGGDEGALENDKKKVNRFKPVVQFAGPYTILEGEKKIHVFKMSNYVGSVRAMVISGANGAYGNAEKAVKVRKGLMLLATLPRVLGPGEDVKLPVTVFAMKENVKNVEVTIKPSDIFEIIGGSKDTLTFNELGDKLAYFSLKTKKQVGAGKVLIEAKSGAEKATYEIEIEIRNPNPPKTVEQNSVIKKGQNWEATLNAPGLAGTNKAWLEISQMPPLNISRYLDYLIRYPHGCIEQTTSAVFPQLYLDKLTEVTPEQKLEIEENIRVALRKLLKFQTADGGFGYWPGNTGSNEWSTCYAGHFMILAEQQGYSLPIGMKAKWLRYQQNAARNWNRKAGYRNGHFYSGHDLIQSYRIYTLALSGNPDFGSMNRFREECETNTAKWRLAASYLLAGQKKVAEKMVEGLKYEIEAYIEMGGTYGSALRDKAMILETLVNLKKDTDAFILLKEISEEINRRSWLSTQTAAWCFYAAAKFAEQNVTGSGINLALSINDKNDEFKTTVPVYKVPVNFKDDGTIDVKVENKGDQLFYARIVARGIPLTDDSEKNFSHLNMSVWYTNKEGKTLDPSELYQGDDFKVYVKLKHPGVRQRYEELALTTIFPSGWEILNQRVNDVPNINNQQVAISSFDYQGIRDDRVYTYFDLGSGAEKTYVFQLNAAYEGRFYLPAISCEAMYDNSVNARIPGRWVEVKKR